MSKQKEKDLENIILTYLLYLPNSFFFKINTTGVYDPIKKIYRANKNKFIVNGVSDILGVINGRFIALEVKTPENKVRPNDQQAFIDRINYLGGKAGFVTSLSDVKQLIDEVISESGSNNNTVNV
jgi:hypothetical protein